MTTKTIEYQVQVKQKSDKFWYNYNAGLTKACARKCLANAGFRKGIEVQIIRRTITVKEEVVK